MSNPWEKISLSDYENHMSLDSVKQLQTIHEECGIQAGKAGGLSIAEWKKSCEIRLQDMTGTNEYYLRD